MLPRMSLSLRPSVLAMSALILGWSLAPQARAQTASQEVGPGAGVLPAENNASTPDARAASNWDRYWPGVFEVVCPAGCYGGGFHWFSRHAFAGAGYYGYFRRYWGYGAYGPNYSQGPGSSPIGHGCGILYVATPVGHKFLKHGGGDCLVAGGDGFGAPGMNPAAQPADGKRNPPAEKPATPAAKTAHLQLLVPENAEVLVNGGKTTTTGAVRDFESPSLDSGKNLSYTIVVRYRDADGKPVEESHVIAVHPNDQLRIDCTQPRMPTARNVASTRPAAPTP